MKGCFCYYDLPLDTACLLDETLWVEGALACSGQSCSLAAGQPGAGQTAVLRDLPCWARHCHRSPGLTDRSLYSPPARRMRMSLCHPPLHSAHATVSSSPAQRACHCVILPCTARMPLCHPPLHSAHATVSSSPAQRACHCVILPCTAHMLLSAFKQRCEFSAPLSPAAPFHRHTLPSAGRPFLCASIL